MLYRFFAGRYGGNDTLNKFLLVVYLVIIVGFFVALLFIRSLWLELLSNILPLLLAIFIIYRTLSRNITKRRLENDRFCNFFKLRKNRFRDRKTHVYRKCRKCKAVLRLPKAKGKHTVVCPRCKNRFEVRG